MFAPGLIGVALISYFGPGGHDVYASLVTGLGCGFALALLGRRNLRADAAALNRPLPRLTIFNVLTAAAGIGLIVWGAGAGEWSIALAGLPLLAFGVGLIAARTLLDRRMDTH